MNIPPLLALPVNTVKAWIDDEAPSMGAAVAYYTFFSMAPLLLIVVAVAGPVFGEYVAMREILAQLIGLVGVDGARAVDGLLSSAAKPVEVLNAALGGATRWLEPAFGGWVTLAAVLSQAIGVVLVSLLFALIYKLLPRTPIRWADVWVGAVVTALLFSVGKWLIGVYLAQVAVASAFGAAGSLVVVLVWVYYSAQVFLLGAEFTRLYAQRTGTPGTEVADVRQ